jgi:hypothetical protein
MKNPDFKIIAFLPYKNIIRNGKHHYKITQSCMVEADKKPELLLALL